MRFRYHVVFDFIKMLSKTFACIFAGIWKNSKMNENDRARAGGLELLSRLVDSV